VLYVDVIVLRATQVAPEEIS